MGFNAPPVAAPRFFLCTSQPMPVRETARIA